MNQTSKKAKDLKRGDMIRPHIDSAALEVLDVWYVSPDRVKIRYYWQRERNILEYGADTLITVVED